MRNNINKLGVNIGCNTRERHSVGFLLTKNFSMISLSAAIDVLCLANNIVGAQAFGWHIYSPDGKAINACNGIQISVDGSHADAISLPEVIVCSGFDVHDHDHTILIARLRSLATYGVSIGAIFTGAYILAKAGLVNNERVTLHWEAYDSFCEEFPKIRATKALFEIEGKYFTCAGGAATIDMMLALIAQKMGTQIAGQLAEKLVHDRIREANERQRMGVWDRLGGSSPKLLAVVGDMEANLEQLRSSAELARAVDLTPRQLERLFRRYLNTTPHRYYREMRLNRARQLLRQTSMQTVSVALACGFVSASHFTKSYVDHFHRTPTEERRGDRGENCLAA